MVTLNPAWQLGIDERVGSIEVGKDADIAIFSAHPLLARRARASMTLVDGIVLLRPRAGPRGAARRGRRRREVRSEALRVRRRVIARRRRGVAAAARWLRGRGGAAPRSPSAAARIVTVSGPTIEKGTIVISGGKIAAVGADVAVPAGAEVDRRRRARPCTPASSTASPRSA